MTIDHLRDMAMWLCILLVLYLLWCLLVEGGHQPTIPTPGGVGPWT